MQPNAQQFPTDLWNVCTDMHLALVQLCCALLPNSCVACVLTKPAVGSAPMLVCRPRLVVPQPHPNFHHKGLSTFMLNTVFTMVMLC
jgi:hypothetical protein